MNLLQQYCCAIFIREFDSEESAEGRREFTLEYARVMRTKDGNVRVFITLQDMDLLHRHYCAIFIREFVRRNRLRDEANSLVNSRLNMLASRGLKMGMFAFLLRCKA